MRAPICLAGLLLACRSESDSEENQIGQATTPSCELPAQAQPRDTSQPTTIVGNGTPESCTAQALVDAVAGGGVVTFSCGEDPVEIAVPELHIFNDGGLGDGSVTIDGGSSITLRPAGSHRIFYQNTCDQSLHWTSTRCDLQRTPNLVLQNIRLKDGSVQATDTLKGGGALYIRGGTLTLIGVTFENNQAAGLGPDFAGGAFYATGTGSVVIADSQFLQNSASNGGAIGTLNAPLTVFNSQFDENKANGNGRNPAKPKTPGGGLGGAIYSDGTSYSVSICDSEFVDNRATELGTGAIFQVVNDLKGNLVISSSRFFGNSNDGQVQLDMRPGIYVEAQDKQGTAGVTIIDTIFE